MRKITANIFFAGLFLFCFSSTVPMGRRENLLSDFGLNLNPSSPLYSGMDVNDHECRDIAAEIFGIKIEKRDNKCAVVTKVCCWPLFCPCTFTACLLKAPKDCVYLLLKYFCSKQ